MMCNSFWIRASGTPATAQAVMAHMPTGGVSRPKACVITTMTPRCTGWMPTSTASGWMIGTKIRIAGSASMNVPRKTLTTTISSITTSQSRVKPRMNFVTRSGTW